MIISVSSNGSRPTEEVDILRVAYDFSKDRFVMAAEVLVLADEPFRPLTLGFSYGRGYVTFDSDGEAERFSEWLRSTDAWVQERLAEVRD